KTKVVWVDTAKRPWRILTSLLNFVAPGGSTSWDCIQVRESLSRVRETSRMIRIWSGGLKVSLNGDKHYISGMDDFVESKVELRSEWLRDGSWFRRLELEIKALETLALDLNKSITSYFRTQGVSKTKKAGLYSNLFWQQCEREFQRLVNACDDGVCELKQVENSFAEIALNLFDQACPKDSIRQLDAWAVARLPLSKKLQKYCNRKIN
ncbi:MAG: type I-E CRISPR-associated protein Cse1/CasA, partial [Bdellovibrionales bacterium]|nr:type I-E CRISPR-associated protein Cse1/CasA [Bdellovibrionales bacterium]